MRDHIVVVDLPNNQARAQAVLAKAKESIPNKPVRFVVTSHHHWDHLGGIREAFAENATIVTHESNKRFLERVAKTPHTLSPDRQAMVNGRARIQTVKDRGVLTDGTRTIELHLMTNLDHNGDMLLVYLPKEKNCRRGGRIHSASNSGSRPHPAGRSLRQSALRQHQAAEVGMRRPSNPSTAAGRPTSQKSAKPASCERHQLAGSRQLADGRLTSRASQPGSLFVRQLPGP